MKKSLLFLYSTLCIAWATPSHSTFAQVDSIRITHTQETGTLEKQRFIDRYDYVFMTKEPTKWMVNIAYSTEFQIGGFQAAFEGKISPSISIATGLNFKNNSYNSPSYLAYWAEIRCYYDMVRRIREGKNANNFSGNYVSIMAFSNLNRINSTGIYVADGVPFSSFKDGIKARWGMQRRFFKHGLVDWGIDLSYSRHQTPFLNGEGSLALSTWWKIGVTWGDLKKTNKIPACEVLRCYEEEKQLWKVAWPRLQLGTNRQSVILSAGYERKVGKSNFSVNTQVNGSYAHFIDKGWQKFVGTNRVKGAIESSFTNLQLMVQPRFYLPSKQAQQQTFNHLSGLYVGVFSQMVYWDNYAWNINESLSRPYSLRLEIGPTLGFQQKLFKNLYLDANAALGFLLKEFNPNSSKKGPEFRGFLNSGFAF